MRIAFAALLLAHGLIHLLGPAKAFGVADVSQLRQPITPFAGTLWLLASMLLVAAGVVVLRGDRWWWALALSGALLSQALISISWSDAKAGTLANIIIAVPLVLIAVDARPGSFRSQFRATATTLLTAPMRPAPMVGESDIAGLPELMQVYLRRSGAVGRPRVRNMRVVFSAQMRDNAEAPWMESTATQYEFFDPPARLFYMTASRSGVPFDVLHRYVGSDATFQVRIASVYPMVDKAGPVLTKAETVTLMNDIVVMAPAAVLDLPFTWEQRGPHRLQATFVNAGNTVSATLEFDAAGDLIGFVSDDRTQEDASGSRSARWSTPITGYATVDGIRIGTRGDANWIEADGREWTYGRFTIREIAYNQSTFRP